MYEYLISIIELAALLLVVGTNFGEYSVHSDNQLKRMQGRYPVLIDKVSRLI